MDAQVTISGSYRKHFDRIVEAKEEFQALGAKVLRPQTDQISSADEELVRLEGDPSDLRAIQEAQLSAIRGCDLLFVVNPGGYLGPSATLEVGYAHGDQIPVVTSETPFEPAVAALVQSVGDPGEALKTLQEIRGSE